MFPRAFSLCSLLAVAATSLLAQEFRPIAEDTAPSAYRQTTRQRYPNALGFVATSAMGSGITYRRWFSDSWGAQLTVLPYYHETHYPSSDETYWETRTAGYQHDGYLSAGLSVMHSIAEADFIRFYGYGGGSVLENFLHSHYMVSGDSAYRDERDQSANISAGLGAGLDIYIWRFDINATVGMHGSYDVSKKSKEVGPDLGIGGFVRF